MSVKTSVTDALERELGAQVRRARLQADVDQATLAKRASISIGALRNLETGAGARITTLVRVLRELDLTYWLTTLAPEPELGPIDRLEGRDVPAEPKRASARRKEPKDD